MFLIKKVSSNEKDVECGSKKKSSRVCHSKEEKGKNKMKRDGGGNPCYGDNRKVSFDFF